MNYAAALIYFPKITYARAKKLLTFFPNPKKIFDSEFDELIKAGFEEQIAHEFMNWRETISVEKISNELITLKIKTVSLSDPHYPRLLREITDPPPVLFYRGTLLSDNHPAISVVGTRKCTAYGKQITESFCGELAQAGVAIISGLALGIDGIAHEAALAQGGLTVAVLGSGVDPHHVYPPAHQALAERIIAKGGAIISEYPPGFDPTQYSFPQRNRVIAGLSCGTLITEAPKASGALITASRCLDYNRDIYVIPHPVTSTQGAGGNELLKKGAQPVTTAQDILEAMQLQEVKITLTKPAPSSVPSNPTEKLIFDHLSNEPKHIDELIQLTGLPSSSLGGTLTLLEMRGKIRNVGGMSYILA